MLNVRIRIHMLLVPARLATAGRQTERDCLYWFGDEHVSLWRCLSHSSEARAVTSRPSLLCQLFFGIGRQ